MVHKGSRLFGRFSRKEVFVCGGVNGRVLG